MQSQGAKRAEYLLWALALVVFYGPVVNLLVEGLQPTDEGFMLASSLQALALTAAVAVGVVLVAGWLGVSVAWSLYFYKPIGTNFLRIAFFLPLVFPAYVLAFIALGALGPTSFSPQGQIWGLVLVLSGSLYPYLYIFTYAGLHTLDQGQWETHQLFGLGRFSFVRRVVLRQIFPFLISGMMLILFETMADFGAASIINVPVMTTYIYKIWYGYFSFPGAMLVASYYMLVVLFFMFLERKLGLNVIGQQVHRPLQSSPTMPVRLLATAYLWIVLAVSFLAPLVQIIKWSFVGMEDWGASKSGLALLNSLSLGFVSSLIVIIAAVLLAYLLRGLKGNFPAWKSMVSVGYGMPGAVVAVALTVIAVAVGAQKSFAIGLLVLFLAMFYKYFTGGFRGISEAIQGIPLNLDDYHQTTEQSHWQYLRKGHWPLLKPAVLAAFAYVAIEVFKEMPVTLMLAPTQFDTLSIQIYNFTSEGEWEKAAVPGLFMILAGVGSTLLLYRRTHRGFDETN